MLLLLNVYIIFKFHLKTIYELVVVKFCMRVQVILRQVIGTLDCSEINFAIDLSPLSSNIRLTIIQWKKN